MDKQASPSPVFPRVLIFSSSVFNEFTGGGVFLSNLFRGWPLDRLAAAHGDSFEEDHSVCGNFFRLGPEELRPLFPLSLFRRPKSGFSSVGTRPTPKDDQTDSRGSLYRMARGAAYKLIGTETPQKILLSDRLRRWIDDFNPEVLYTLAGGPYMRAAMQIADAWKIPIAAHMMDDWPQELQTKKVVIPFLKNRRLEELEELFEKSAVRMGICDQMCEAYERRYGLSFVPFQNAVETADRLPHSKKDWSVKGAFRLCYVGSIMPNAQLQSLVDVARAVTTLKEEGLNIELNIYSPWAKAFQSQLEISSAIHLHPPLGEAKIFSGLTSSDLLLIPVNFDPVSVSYIRHSMPAKIPLYLVSGTPILVYGPAEAASVRYASQEGWGAVVTENRQEKLVEAIRELYGDSLRRESLGKRAVRVALQHHDGPRVRDAFRAQLAGMVKR